MKAIFIYLFILFCFIFRISIISNLCLIVAAILDIVSHFGTEAFLSDTVNLLLGLGKQTILFTTHKQTNKQTNKQINK